MFGTILVLSVYFSDLILAQGTTNICVPLQSADIKDIEETKDLLEEIKSEIVGSLTIKNDPLYIDSIDLNLNHPAIRITGMANNIHIYNLHHYSICLLNAVPESQKFNIFNLTFPSLKVEGAYSISGDFGELFDIKGNGTFWFELKNISLAADHHYQKTAKETCLPVNITINLSEINSHFDNLMDDEELGILINNAIHTIGPESLEMLWSEIKDIFDKPKEIFKDIFNNKMFSKVVSNAFMTNKTLSYCFSNNDILATDISVILI